MVQKIKSSMYPSVTWNEGYEFVKAVDTFKLSAVASVEVAKKYGLTSATTNSHRARISTAKQFGLITISNNTLQLTDTCKRILYPTGEDIRNVVLACFSMPPLYAKLIATYDGKALPTQEILGNILMSTHRITKVAKDTAAKCFLESANELGLIQGGVLSFTGSESVVPARHDENPEEKSGETTAQNQDDSEQFGETSFDDSKRQSCNNYISQTVPMASGTVAKIVIPEDADESSLLLLKDMFDAVLRRKFNIGSQ
jgi:hypothetical protein